MSVANVYQLFSPANCAIPRSVRSMLCCAVLFVSPLCLGVSAVESVEMNRRTSPSRVAAARLGSGTGRRRQDRSERKGSHSSRVDASSPSTSDRLSCLLCVHTALLYSTVYNVFLSRAPARCAAPSPLSSPTHLSGVTARRDRWRLPEKSSRRWRQATRREEDEAKDRCRRLRRVAACFTVAVSVTA